MEKMNAQYEAEKPQIEAQAKPECKFYRIICSLRHF